MVDHVILRGWNKNYASTSFERWHIAEIMTCNMKNRAKPSQIIFLLVLLTYLNKKWDLRSQLGTLQLPHSCSDQTLTMRYSEILH